MEVTVFGAFGIVVKSLVVNSLEIKKENRNHQQHRKISHNTEESSEILIRFAII